MSPNNAFQLRFAILHGTLLLVLGILLDVIACFMVNTQAFKAGYILSILLVAAAICAPLWQMLDHVWSEPEARQSLVSILLTVTVLMAGAAFILWVVAPSDLGISFILVLAALLGAVWTGWHWSLARRLKAYPILSMAQVVLAAISAGVGVVLAAYAVYTPLAAVTAAACFATWLGSELLLTAPVLFWIGRPSHAPAEIESRRAVAA